MFLQSAYKNMPLISASKKFVHHCYVLTAQLADEEKNIIGHQLKQAVLTAHLHLIEGYHLSSKKRKKKYRLFDEAIKTLVLADALLDIIQEMQLLPLPQVEEAADLLASVQKMAVQAKHKKK